MITVYYLLPFKEISFCVGIDRLAIGQKVMAILDQTSLDQHSRSKQGKQTTMCVKIMTTRSLTATILELYLINYSRQVSFIGFSCCWSFVQTYYFFNACDHAPDVLVLFVFTVCYLFYDFFQYGFSFVFPFVSISN
jgi:hypothetical protein